MPRLTNAKFFELLKERSQKHRFHIKGGFIRECRSGKCPINAVATSLGKKGRADNDWDIIADEINLEIFFAQKVVEAADGAEGDDKKMRSKLLAAVGLGEKP